MLIIQPTQLADLSRRCERQFVQRAVQHLRNEHADQCVGKADTALQRYVEAILDFAAKHRISQQQCVLRLIDLQVALHYPAQLTGYLHYRLTQPEFDESTRVHNFELALRTPRNPILVSLDSDLRALQTAHG